MRVVHAAFSESKRLACWSVGGRGTRTHCSHALCISGLSAEDGEIPTAAAHCTQALCIPCIGHARRLTLICEQDVHAAITYPQVHVGVRVEGSRPLRTVGVSGHESSGQGLRCLGLWMWAEAKTGAVGGKVLKKKQMTNLHAHGRLPQLGQFEEGLSEQLPGARRVVHFQQGPQQRGRGPGRRVRDPASGRGVCCCAGERGAWDFWGCFHLARVVSFRLPRHARTCLPASLCNFEEG